MNPPALVEPWTRTDAIRACARLDRTSSTPEARLLRGRYLRAIEAWPLAWHELSALRGALPTPLHEARLEHELICLAQHAGVSVASGDLDRAVGLAGGDALLVAETAVAWSAHQLATGDASGSLAAAYRALDALRGAGRARQWQLVNARAQRQLASALAHSALYGPARRAAATSVAAARRVGDTSEVAASAYVAGFAAWCAGAPDAAEPALDEAAALLRAFGTSTWFATLLCLGRTRIERGHVEEGARLVRSSGASPSERAFVALACGRVDLAWDVLRDAPPSEAPYNDVVRAIVHVRRGEARFALALLEHGRRAFSAKGLDHFALGCAAHLAYAHERIGDVSAPRRGVSVTRYLADRGATGFAWFLPEVAAWLGWVAARDAKAADTARVLTARSESAQADRRLEPRSATGRNTDLSARERTAVLALIARVMDTRSTRKRHAPWCVRSRPDTRRRKARELRAGQ